MGRLALAGMAALVWAVLCAMRWATRPASG
jgi:hypothetical protein